MIELELKSVVPDPDALRHRLLGAAGAPDFAGRMLDQRYDLDERLTPVDQVLRVRRYEPRSGAAREEITWKGATGIDTAGYKSREELEAQLSGGVPIAEILVAIGFRVVHRIDRYVECYSVDGAQVRIEWYPACDTLVEIEGSAEAIEAAIDRTGLPRAGFRADTLTTFADEWSRRTGAVAQLALTHSADQPSHWPV